MKTIVDDVEYIIYCRKSSDEASGNQNQSIPNQIEKCIKYALDNDLKIMKKPLDFSEFESEKDKQREKDEPDIHNRYIYDSVKDLFVVKESESGKIPYKRPKRRSIINHIKKKKIKGIISYAPDRQARNMLEGGELINLVDENLVELKYTNFHFEKNAAGKMMLGIWFVFSKQYVDKLGEDIERGITKKATEGKSLGRYKYGYYRDLETGEYRPDPDTFDIIKEMFHKKIYERLSDSDIAQRLRAQGFRRKYTKNSREDEISGKNLGTVWIDTFYCGRYVYGDHETDMLDKNRFPDFIPLITPEEHQILYRRSRKATNEIVAQKRKDKYEDIIPLPREMVKTLDGYTMSSYLPNPKRFESRLQKLKEIKNDATIIDVVQNHQIRYKAPAQYTEHKKLEISFDIIDAEISKLFSKFRISDDVFEEHKKAISDEIDEINSANQERRRIIIFNMGRVEAEEKKLILKCLSQSRNPKEEEIYQKKLKDFENEQKLLQKDLEKIQQERKSILLEYEAVAQVIKNTAKYYDKASYVQKRLITELFISNIIIIDKNTVRINVHEHIKPLVSHLVEMMGVEPMSK